jgi:hypothetical protein
MPREPRCGGSTVQQFNVTTPPSIQAVQWFDMLTDEPVEVSLILSAVDGCALFETV